MTNLGSRGISWGTLAITERKLKLWQATAKSRACSYSLKHWSNTHQVYMVYHLFTKHSFIILIKSINLVRITFSNLTWYKRIFSTCILGKKKFDGRDRSVLQMFSLFMFGVEEAQIIQLVSLSVPTSIEIVWSFVLSYLGPLDSVICCLRMHSPPRTNPASPNSLNSPTVF